MLLQQSKLVSVQVTTDQLASLMKGGQWNVPGPASVFLAVSQEPGNVPVAPFTAYKLVTLGQNDHDTIARAAMASPSPRMNPLLFNVQRGNRGIPAIPLSSLGMDCVATRSDHYLLLQ